MAYYGAYGDHSGSGSSNGNGSVGRGGGEWYYGGMGGGARYMYGRGAVPGAAGILGAGAGAPAGWNQAVPAAATVQAGNQWGVGEELPPVEANPALAMIRQETLGAAEAAADEVLVRLHPTRAAEKRRHEVIGYAKKLIGTYFGCEVFAFGSVPLKTYLPDGDIDITVLTNASADAAFIHDVHRLLKTEQHNDDCPFQVHELRFIDAEVKLIKCVIGNIIVDISFNQFGGVSTLCFLELVDSEVGKDHLFKRSIMLIKAWCYNECQILGAHHWLLSTYALEILVLHIFNVFHKSLQGPLAALHKFLDYYSNFEWDRYGLSLDGPVPLSSLRKLAADPVAASEELLLSRESLRSSLDRLLQLPADADQREVKFRVKYLNIIDPLKRNNNLGRSVNEESYRRIRSALASGAQRLSQILLQSCPQTVPDEIRRLFENTLKRYGTGERQDLVTGPLLRSPETELSGEDVSSSGTSNLNEDGQDTSPDDSPADQNENGSTDANQEELVLPSKPDLLNLSGDLGQHLGCLRLVQYNLEALFDKFENRVQEASDAGLLNEELFRITASRFLIDNDAAAAPAPRLSAAASSTDVHQQNVLLTSGSQAPTNGWPSSPPPVADAGIYNGHPIYATDQEIHDQTLPYMPDMFVPLSSGIGDAMVDLAMSTSHAAAAYAEGYHDPWFHMAGCLPRTPGTGTYIPRPYGLYRDYVPRRHRHRQPHHVQSGSQRAAGESSRSQTPMRQNTSQQQQQAPRAPHFRARSSTGGLTWKVLNRAGDGSSGSSSSSSSSQPPALAVTDHGDNAQGVHLAVAATAGGGVSSSPAAGGGVSSSPATSAAESSKPASAGGQSLSPAAGGGVSSPPAAAVGKSSSPAVSAGESSRPATIAAAGEPSIPAAVTVAAAGESSKCAATGKDLKPIEEEKLEFGTLGPLSPTLFTPKFVEDFPPLPATRRPTAPTLKISWPAEAPGSPLQSTKPGPCVAHTRTMPAESSAPTVRSPKHGPAAAQTRPLLLQALASNRPGVYRLKDEADFPPLQGGTR